MVHRLGKPLPPQVVSAHLGSGESGVLALAIERRADRVILDERAARGLAQSLGIPMIGTLGILLAAKRKGLIPAIREPIDTLRDSGFRVATDLYETTLRQANELA